MELHGSGSGWARVADEPVPRTSDSPKMLGTVLALAIRSYNLGNTPVSGKPGWLVTLHTYTRKATYTRVNFVLGPNIFNGLINSLHEAIVEDDLISKLADDTEL